MLSIEYTKVTIRVLNDPKSTRPDVTQSVLDHPSLTREHRVEDSR